MPTFSAVALDRLLDSGASETAAVSNKSASSSPSAAASNGGDANLGTRRLPHPQPGWTNSTSVETESRAAQWPQISPALYVTPEATPLSDSPDSVSSTAFPSSPYVVNHKRRGPRLLKCYSEKDEKSGAGPVNINGHLSGSQVASNGHFGDRQLAGNGHLGDVDGKGNCSTPNAMAGDAVEEELKVNGFQGRETGDGKEGYHHHVMGGNEELGAVTGLSVEGECETEDFFDPPESMSYTSNTDVEDNNTDDCMKMSAPNGDFFDAWEELSSDSGRQSQHPIHRLEAELSILMEIEKRKQAEEALSNMQDQWQILREKMKNVGLVLPPDRFSEDGKLGIDIAEEICRQIYLARYISEGIGIEVAKAEAKSEMEDHLEAKNFEISRLNDRLRYYETMSREMSWRNQETLERARHDRQKRKRRLHWVWGSVGIAIAVGSMALAWCYGPGGKVLPSSDHFQAAQPDAVADR